MVGDDIRRAASLVGSGLAGRLSLVHSVHVQCTFSCSSYSLPTLYLSLISARSMHMHMHYPAPQHPHKCHARLRLCSRRKGKAPPTSL